MINLNRTKKKKNMEADYIRRFINKLNLTHYEVSKRSGLSINGIAYFMKEDSRPQRSTLNKLIKFVETFSDMSDYSENNKKVFKDISDYSKNNINAFKDISGYIENNKQVFEDKPQMSGTISNKQIYNLIQSLGVSLGNNAAAVSKVLNLTFDNTKNILVDTNEIKWRLIDKASEDLIKNK
jgi:transcriptional regulator with XRE-family HTH domain